MRPHCTHIPLKLPTKGRLQLLVLSAVAFTLTTFYICWSSPTSFHIGRRPKTLLIYNNEHLCSSNASELNSNNQHRHRSIVSSTTTPHKISIVIVVPSRRKNSMQRNLIRQTYGSIRSVNNVNILAVVFMLGNADALSGARADRAELDVERIRFGDIIMGDLVDSYRNLSRKSIMAYDWLTSYCSEADLVVKTDDDVVVDIFKLTAELGKWSSFEPFKFWCSVHKMEKIIRDRKSIYYVSRKEYARKVFPKHCAGVGYVTTMRLVRRIADEISKSFRGPICSHEDVFLTGIVPERINSAGYEPPIEHVNKRKDWIFYVDEHNPIAGGKYIWKVAGEAVNETVDFDEFRKQSGTRIFYLLQQNVDFERKFLRLWYLVENSFRNEEVTIATDIK